MNPRAIYYARVIYNPTNNADYIQYLAQKPHTIYKHIFALYVSRNVTAHAQSTSTTHFSCSSKCRRTSLYKTYHRIFDFSNQKLRVRSLTSRRQFLCAWNMYYYQQRWLYKILNQKIPHFRCYYNIQPPVRSYIYINYYIHIYIIILFIQLYM